MCYVRMWKDDAPQKYATLCLIKGANTYVRVLVSTFRYTSMQYKYIRVYLRQINIKTKTIRHSNEDRYM